MMKCAKCGGGFLQVEGAQVPVYGELGVVFNCNVLRCATTDCLAVAGFAPIDDQRIGPTLAQ